AGPSRREADEAKAATAIQEYLAGQKEPVDESAIHEAVEGRKAVKVRALRSLVADAKVTRTGEGKKGRPYLYVVPTGAPPPPPPPPRGPGGERQAPPDKNSGIQVPVYSQELETKNPKTAETRRQPDLFSGSRENTPEPGPSEAREPASAVLTEALADDEDGEG